MWKTILYVLPFISILLLSITLKESYACLFRIKSEMKTNTENPWSHGFPRKISKLPCECGKDPIEYYDYPPFPDTEHNIPIKPWHFYIHLINTKNQSLMRTCTGTLINNKMILTSHNCLRLKKHSKITPYEKWDPPPQYMDSVMASIEHIMVTMNPEYPPRSSTDHLKVRKIIYNPTLMEDNSKEDGVAIIVLADNLDIDKISPICVPKDAKYFDPIGYKGYYYGVGGDLEADPNAELRFVGNVVILPWKICSKANDASHKFPNDTLCVQYRRPPPKSLGGPLIMAEDGTVNRRGFTPGRTVFLLGLATVLEEKPKYDFETSIVTTYFLNILPFLPFLEYHAIQLDARWCKTPDLNLDMANIVNPFEKGLMEKYEWEGKDPIRRDESLDCVCGIDNSGAPIAQSRILGGTNATLTEFPWMTHSRFFPSNDQCGGVMINDRMFMTSAYCALQMNRLFSDDESEIYPDTVALYFNKHVGLGNDPHINIVPVNGPKVFMVGDFVDGARQAADSFVFDGDIALIELNRPLQFSAVKDHALAMPLELRPICLPRANDPIDVVGIKNAVVTGWGFNLTIGEDPYSAMFEYPEVLQKLEVPILPLEECIKRTAEPLRDTAMLCAGYFDKFKDVSFRDNGGPLMIKQTGGYWTQVGIVSYSKVEQDTDIAISTYTNVQRYLRFIDYYSNKVGAKWCKSYV